MKLYGLAVAALPHKGNSKLINIICNPVAVDKDHQEKLEVAKDNADLKNLAFTASVDMSDPKSVSENFKKFVETMDAVIRLQEASCEKAGMSYQPIALTLGQDSRNPVSFKDKQDDRSLDNIYFTLLSQSYTHAELSLRIDIAKQRVAHDEVDIAAVMLQPPRPYTMSYEVTDNDRKEIAELSKKWDEIYKQNDFKIDPADHYGPLMHNYQIHRDQLINLKEEYAQLEKAQPAHKETEQQKRKHLLAQPDLAEVRKTYNMFADAMKKSTLGLGSYGAVVDLSGHREYWKNAMEEDLRSDLDIKLNHLREMLQGDSKEARAEAHNEILGLAREEGQRAAEMVNKNDRIFITNSLPPGFLKNEKSKPEDQEKALKLQEKYPRFSYLEWDPAYKAAFRESLKQHYRGKFTRNVKTPMDPPMPPFTDPVADRIRDQFQVMDKSRASWNVDDDVGLRKMIENSARCFASALETEEKMSNWVELMQARKAVATSNPKPFP